MIREAADYIYRYTSIPVDVVDNLLIVNKGNIVRVLQCIKKDLGYHQLVDIFASIGAMNCIQILYQCLNYDTGHRLIIKLILQEDEAVASVSNIYANANFYEREIFDLFGVLFFNHPDLRRIF